MLSKLYAVFQINIWIVLFEIVFYELADTQFFQLKIDCDERLVMLKFNKFKYFLLSFATI